MKKIETKNERTVVDIITTYVAVDGTKFHTQEECVSYENTALCVVKAKYNALVTGHTDENSLCSGSEDNQVDIVAVKSEEDVTTVAHLVEYICSHREDTMQEIISLIKEAFTTNTPLFVCWNYDRDWVHVIGCVDTLVKRFSAYTND